MNKRIEDIIAETRLNEILHKNEAEKQKNTVIWTLAIIGAVAAVAAIAYAVYRFVSPDYLDDFEDDFDDDFDDYFSEDDQVYFLSELQKCRQGERRNHPVCFSVKID